METSQQNALRVYKNNRIVTKIQQLPIRHQERISTDTFCTVCTSLFALTVLVISLVSLDLTNLQRMTYPTDQDGRHCTLDNSNFNYIYFTSFKDPSKRLCVSHCPQGGQQKLQCWPTANLSCAANQNSNYEVVIYPSYETDTSLGLYCEAKDQVLNQKLLGNAHLLQMYQFVAAYKSIGIAALSALGIGILGLILFSLMPAVMSYLTTIFGGFGCIFGGTFLLLANSQLLTVYRSIVIVFAIALFIVAFLLLWGSIWKHKDINISITFLKQAISCFWEAPSLALLSFVFIFMLVGLAVLCGFQTLACWSKADMKFEADSIYYRPKGSFAIIMTIVNIVQFLWGLCFLKESFNFLLSGTTVSWYFRQKHSLGFAMGNLFNYHWGSVAGGSFLLHLLYPFDLIYDFIKPSTSNSVVDSLCCCCQRLLDMVRTQTMTFINIMGTPYCNSSRWCQKIEYNSSYMDGSQSSNRFVRIGSHMTLTLCATIVAYFYMQSNGAVSVLALILSFVINLFVLTFFVCLLQDIAEAILFSTLVENYLNNQDQIIKKEINPVAKKLFQEGYEVYPTQY